nr:hypothetical protein [Enterococcus sp. 669A]
MVVYLLLLVLGLVLLVQSYLLFNLIRSQQELERKVAHLSRMIRKPGARKAPPRPKNKGEFNEERGRRR